MKKFWVGVLVGAIGMAIVFIAVPLALNFFVGPRAVAAFQRGDAAAQPPIVFRGLFGSRGEFGSVDAVGDGNFTLATRDGDQKTVLMNAETAIYRGRSKVAQTELLKGQRILVIGTAQNDGSILAKLIRFVTSSFGNPGANDEGRLEN